MPVLPTLAFTLTCMPQAPTQPRDLRQILTAHSDVCRRVVENAETHRLQVLLGEIEEVDGELRLRRSALGSTADYFYPASSVKTCAAVAALLELNRLNAALGTSYGVDSRLTIGRLFEGDEVHGRGSGEPITFGHEIRKLFLVSDNVAYNRLYEFVGHRELNEAMRTAGFASCRIFHRLSEFRSVDEQRHTRPTGVSADGGKWLEREARDSDLVMDNEDLGRLTAGDAYWRGGKRVAEPFSFRYKNSMSLRDLQDMQVELVRPEVDTGKRGFPELSLEQRRFVRRAMSQWPRESDRPKYDAKAYPDDYVKYLLPGVARVIPRDAVRIYNKVGRAYGFSTENAYVEDTRTGRGFFLAAVLYTNPNRTLNDDDYAYEELADPFLADLGEAMASVVWGRGGK